MNNWKVTFVFNRMALRARMICESMMESRDKHPDVPIELTETDDTLSLTFSKVHREFCLLSSDTVMKAQNSGLMTVTYQVM